MLVTNNHKLIIAHNDNDIDTADDDNDDDDDDQWWWCQRNKARYKLLFRSVIYWMRKRMCLKHKVTH